MLTPPPPPTGVVADELQSAVGTQSIERSVISNEDLFYSPAIRRADGTTPAATASCSSSNVPTSDHRAGSTNALDSTGDASSFEDELHQLPRDDSTAPAFANATSSTLATPGGGKRCGTQMSIVSSSARARCVHAYMCAG